MIKQIFVALSILFSLHSFAQEIPVGSCGLLCKYDAAGNRISREYYCNIGPRVATVTGENKETTPFSFEEVDALYPNPTTGKFYITFSKPLDNVLIKVVDVNARLVTQFKASGNKIEVTLANQPAGVYYVVIYDDAHAIRKKVVKL